MKLIIGHIYPDLCNLYGDKGNIQTLKKRCEWRNIEAEVKEYRQGDAIDFSSADLILIGGGTDQNQKTVCHLLKEKKQELKEYIEKGGVMLALCGAYPMLGKFYETARERIEGLEVLDIETVYSKEYRLTDNVIISSPVCDMPVCGFENHGGRTAIGKHMPFGKVIYGSGNDAKSGEEGVLYKNLIATYLYGPLLPKNPQLADYLIRKALERKYGQEISLTELPDLEEKAANKAVFDRFNGKVSRPQDQDQI